MSRCESSTRLRLVRPTAHLRVQYTDPPLQRHFFEQFSTWLVSPKLLAPTRRHNHHWYHKKQDVSANDAQNFPSLHYGVTFQGLHAHAKAASALQAPLQSSSTRDAIHQVKQIFLYRKTTFGSRFRKISQHLCKKIVQQLITVYDETLPHHKRSATYHHDRQLEYLQHDSGRLYTTR